MKISLTVGDETFGFSSHQPWPSSLKEVSAYNLECLKELWYSRKGQIEKGKDGYQILMQEDILNWFLIQEDSEL